MQKKIIMAQLPKITGFCEISNGKLFINNHNVFESNSNIFDKIIAEIINNFKVVHPRFGKMDRLAQLGYTCIEILLQNVDITKYKSDEIALLLSNNSSSLDTDLRFQKSIESIPSPALFVYTLPNIVLAEVCIKNKIKGENIFFISENFNIDLMLVQINELFNNTSTKACIGGWIEIFEENYKGFVFMVEKEFNNNNIDFTKDNIIEIFKK